MGRERVAFNFKELIKSFFGNGEAYVKDNAIEREVNEIIAMQDSDFINKQEKAVTTGDSKAGVKKSDKINLIAAKKEEVAKSIDEKTRDEER